MEKFTATFVKEKDTKNTIRYQEQTENGQPPRIVTLYVQKWTQPPDKIKVTVEPA
jgi:hypothetical protein